MPKSYDNAFGIDNIIKEIACIGYFFTNLPFTRLVETVMQAELKHERIAPKMKEAINSFRALDKFYKWRRERDKIFIEFYLIKNQYVRELYWNHPLLSQIKLAEMLQRVWKSPPLYNVSRVSNATRIKEFTQFGEGILEAQKVLTLTPVDENKLKEWEMKHLHAQLERLANADEFVIATSLIERNSTAILDYFSRSENLKDTLESIPALADYIRYDAAGIKAVELKAKRIAYLTEADSGVDMHEFILERLMDLYLKRAQMLSAGIHALIDAVNTQKFQVAAQPALVKGMDILALACEAIFSEEIEAKTDLDSLAGSSQSLLLKEYQKPDFSTHTKDAEKCKTAKRKEIAGKSNACESDLPLKKRSRFFLDQFGSLENTNPAETSAHKTLEVQFGFTGTANSFVLTGNK